MAGYSDRVGAAEGAHDALWARALVADDGRARAAVLVADVIGFERSVVERLRRGAARLGVPGAHLLVAGTHTHSGPAGLTAPLDDAVVRRTVDGALAALADAIADLEPGAVRLGAAAAPGVGANRRRPDGPTDDGVRVVCLERPESERHGALINFACHPTVLSRTNLLYSADYAGYAVRAVEQRLGEDALVLFANGACGDVSTRFTRRAATFEEAERLGGLLGGGAWRAWTAATAIEASPIIAATRKVALPPRSVPTPADAEDALAAARADLERGRREGTSGGALRLLETTLQGAERTLQLARYGVEPVEAELQVLRLGAVTILGMPFELFTELAAAIRTRTDPAVMIVGYANARLGYVPTRAAYDEGGYEVGVSAFAPDAGDLIVDAAVGAIREARA
jgi:hypothetical protein